jgi:electron transport complex protein RnfG
MKDFIKASAILAAIVLVFGAAMFGLNFVTGPIIEANNAGAALAPLLAVMPEGATFGGDALITDTLTALPASVKAVYKEANGLGYVIQTTATSQYSSAPMEITIGITADGKISGIQIDSYNDTPTYDFRAKDPSYLGSYVGKDSALADIGTVSGATYSSTAFKGAVEEAMSVLITNNMIAEGVKSDAQILEELIPTVAPGFAKLEEVTASGNIEKALKAKGDVGFAYIIKSGDASFLAIVNATGTVKLYDVEGNDVTDANEALATEAKTHATANQKSYKDAAETKFGRMFEGATEMTALNVDTFGTVVYAASFKVGDATYYGFYSRSIGFEQMDVYVVLDENGAIAKLDAKAIFFETEYFPVDDNVDEDAYKDSFIGFTGDTFTGDNAMIAGATMTSNAVKQSTNDAFDAFKTIKNGGAN